MQSAMMDFINPKAMLTPGIAGATIATVTGTLVSQFGLPGNWTALSLSFLIGTVVFLDRELDLPKRLVLFLLNSLIIFSMAVGMNETGRAITEDPQLVACGTRSAPPQGEAPRFFQAWF